MSRAAWFVVAALVVGVGVSSCLVTTDLDGLDAGSGGAGGEPPGGGGTGAGTGGSTTGGKAAGGAGASGGSGGSGLAVPVDWSSSPTALYLFEVADLGRESSGNGLDLVQSGTANQSSDEPPQGDFAMHLFTDGVLAGSYAELDPSDNPSLTFGGWVRIEEFSIDSDVVDNRKNASGYLARVRSFEEALECSIGGDGMSDSATSPDGSIVKGDWVHGLCRYDAAMGTVDVIINGTVAATKVVPPLGAAGLGSFSVGGDMDGELDEVFIAKRALSDMTVRRIYACGLDGAKCQCDPDEPAKYANCGRRHPDCEGALPPCDQSSPSP